jgi:hypothetical protein
VKKVAVILFCCLFNFLSAQLVTNGSVTGAPCANSGITSGNAVGWSTVSFSPDLCCLAMPSYIASSAVAAAVSPDGGTWLGIAALGEVAKTTITGLTVSQTYTLYFCAACFGTNGVYNSAPGVPTISVGTTSVTFSVPRAASTWYKYSMVFTASATTENLFCSANNSGSNSYIDLDGFSLSPTSPCGPTPLPVEMIDFKASYNSIEKRVDLNWSTATEKNVERYAIERSDDAESFFEIRSVKSYNGESHTIQKYSAVDADAVPNKTNYYRIVTIDKDGQKNVSQTQAVTFSDVDANLAVLPNPASGSIQLTFKSNIPQSFTIQFTDSHGRVVDTKNVAVDAQNTGKFSFDISEFKAGLYFVNVIDGSAVYKRKFVKE